MRSTCLSSTQPKTPQTCQQVADLLQLVETNCTKPVDNTFRQSTCKESVDNLQIVVNKLSQAIRTHPDIDLL